LFMALFQPQNQHSVKWPCGSYLAANNMVQNVVATSCAFSFPP
jgi:hypothetical protein